MRKSMRTYLVLTPVILVSALAVVAFVVWRPDRSPARAQREAISELKDLGTMVELDEYGNAVSLRVMPGEGPAALQHLSDLPRLQSLYLNLAEVDDDDLALLQGGRQLRNVFLSGTPITDEGLKHLQGLNQMQSLYLTGTAVDGSGLEYVSHARQLEELNLANTQVTDANLSHLSGLTNLKALDVTETQISDEGLKHLTGLKNLKMLGVIGARVTTAGAAKLQEQLPDLSVRFKF